MPLVDLTYTVPRIGGSTHFTLHYNPGFIAEFLWVSDCGTVAGIPNSRYVLGCQESFYHFANVFYSSSGDCTAGTPIAGEGLFTVEDFTCDPFLIFFDDGSSITIAGGASVGKATPVDLPTPEDLALRRDVARHGRCC